MVPPVIAQLEHAFVNRGVVDHYRPAVAQAAQHLRRIEADSRRNTERASAAPLELGAEGLRGVLHNQQAVLVRDGLQGIHVTGPTVQLRREDCLRAGCGCTLDSRRVDQVIRPAFHWDWRGAGEVNGRGRGDHGVRAENDFVARPNASRA